MTQHIPVAVLWCLLAGTLLVVVLLVRERQISATLRRRTAALDAGVRTRDEEARHLATVRLPALMEALHHRPVMPPGLLHEQLTGSAFAQALQMVADLFDQAVESARTRADQSAKAALKASMRALQGLANEQQLAISDMQERHDDADMLQDLMEIDHANSQFGRRAQAIAVLCGSWPGRQRAASPLYDVVRGATSRIRDYRRVEIHSQVDIAAVSRAVEPLVLTIAELLDNAARHSQPNTMVQVSIQPAHNGTVIVVDDAGVGLHGQEVQQAGRLLSGRQAVDINRLGDPPQFGFAVIGVLAARYGFSVSVDTRSPYGGVRAVAFIPNELLAPNETDTAAPVPAAPTVPRQRSSPPAQRAIAGGAPPAPPQSARLEARPEPEPRETPRPEPLRLTAGGLPKRRRRQPVTEHTQPGPPPEPAAAARPRSAEQAAAVMGAFQRGTRSGRAADPDPAAPELPTPDASATPDNEGHKG